MSKPTILSIIAFVLSLIALILSAAHGETTIIWNPDGTTTTIIDNGTNGTVWNGGIQGTINDNGDSFQYWENGGGVTTVPHGERPRWELPPIDVPNP